MAYIEFARRKPTGAQTRQKISRALKGKKKRLGRSVQKAIQKTTGKKFVNKKAYEKRKKTAAVGLGVAGGLGAAALVLSQRKAKNPSVPGALPGAKNPLMMEAGTPGAKGNGRSYSPTPGASRARGEENSNYAGGGVGRRERVGRSPYKKPGLNMGALKKRFGK